MRCCASRGRQQALAQQALAQAAPVGAPIQPTSHGGSAPCRLSRSQLSGASAGATHAASGFSVRPILPTTVSAVPEPESVRTDQPNAA
eukprot:SAG31_NODE_6557_length_1978_cov_4.922299_3_plen_87_part_01